MSPPVCLVRPVFVMFVMLLMFAWRQFLPLRDEWSVPVVHVVPPDGRDRLATRTRAASPSKYVSSIIVNVSWS